MSVNLSYCRYQNTHRALDELTELCDFEVPDLYELSDDEMQSLKYIVKRMDWIAEKFKLHFGGGNITESLSNMEKKIKEYEDELN